MIGNTPIERARTRAAERVAELGVLGAIATIFQNTLPSWPGGSSRAEAAENANTRLQGNLAVLDKSRLAAVRRRQPAEHRRLHFSPRNRRLRRRDHRPRFKNINRWYEDFKTRPSAQA
jgi:hypothetical protein